ncbi:MAG: hypothetical protein IKQ25_11035 [Lachnospiraceae bacterium]|nr:hypothetical protein [Lachnospiraceae bacterium]
MKCYQVSKYFKFTLVLAATSIFLLLFYITELLRYYFPKQINEFNMSNLKNRQYVSITSNECIPAPGGKGNASDAIFLSLTEEYIVYRLRIGKQGTIDVGIYDKATQSTLEAWPEGRGGSSSVTIVARVNKDGGSVILLQVLPAEMKTHYGILSFLSGIFFIVTLLMFLTIGGIKVVYERPFEDSRRYKEIYLGQNYHLEEELVREKNMLERYQQEKEKNKEDIKLGVGIVLGALFVLGFCFFISLGSVTSAANAILAGISVLVSVMAFYVLLWGIKILWNAYVNSDSPRARKISEQFMLHTLSIRREESEKLIRLMTIKLEEQKEKMRKLEEENQRLWQGKEDGKMKEESSNDESNVIK